MAVKDNISMVGLYQIRIIYAIMWHNLVLLLRSLCSLFWTCKFIPFGHVFQETFFRRQQRSKHKKVNIREQPPADVWNKLQSNLFFCWTMFWHHNKRHAILSTINISIIKKCKTCQKRSYDDSGKNIERQIFIRFWEQNNGKM